MFRIHFLFILTMFLSACGAQAAPTQTAEATPTTEATPITLPTVVPENSVVISTEPAGSAPTAESPQSGSAEFFITLSVDDVQYPNPSDMAVLDEVVERDNEIVTEMNRNLQKVADICGVPAQYLKPVWKAHTAIDPDTSRKVTSWTRVYEAIVPAGQDIPEGTYTCWTRDEAGILNVFPTAWDRYGNLVVNDGNCFERLEGEFRWAGGTPVIYNPTKNKFVIPGGINNDKLLLESSWMTLSTESTGEAGDIVVSPFTSGQMAHLDESGYTYRASGDLVNSYGNIAMSYRDGKWVDGGGNEFSFDTFRIIEIDGYDYDGRPLNIVSFDVNGEQRVSLPSGESAKPIDLSASRALVDEHGKTNPTRYDWGTYENITFDRISVISQEDKDSGLLFLSRVMNLRPWTDQIRPSVLKYIPLNSEAGSWTLSFYDDSSFELNNHNGDHYPGFVPIVWKNDPMVNLDVVKYIDSATGKWVINSGIQLFYDKDSKTSFVISVEYRDAKADPNDPDFPTTQSALGNPSWTIVRPKITLDQAFSAALRAKIQEFAGKPQVDSDVTGVVIAEMSDLAALQEESLVPIISLQHQMQSYLIDPTDPDFELMSD